MAAMAVILSCASHGARASLATSLGFTKASSTLSNGLVHATLDNLLVVIDFDRTITDGTSAQCHDLIGAAELMPSGLRAEFRPLLDFSTPYAQGLGDTWWMKANELLLEHCKELLTPAMVQSLVQAAPLFGTSTQPMRARPGAIELLTRLQELGVPVLIVSAGFTDIIEGFLKAHDVTCGSALRISSNEMVFGATGGLVAVEPAVPITSRNKHTTFARNREWFECHHARRHVLLIGDSLGDLRCAEGMPGSYSIATIGVCNENDDRASLAHYTQDFDAVIHGDAASLTPVSALVEALQA